MDEKLNMPHAVILTASTKASWGLGLVTSSWSYFTEARRPDHTTHLSPLGFLPMPGHYKLSRCCAAVCVLWPTVRPCWLPARDAHCPVPADHLVAVHCGTHWGPCPHWRPLHGHCGQVSDPTALHGHCGQVGDPTALQWHHGQMGDPTTLHGHHGQVGDPTALHGHHGQVSDPTALHGHHGQVGHPTALHGHCRQVGDPTALHGHHGQVGDPTALHGHHGQVGDPTALHGHCGQVGDPTALHGHCGQVGDPTALHGHHGQVGDLTSFTWTSWPGGWSNSFTWTSWPGRWPNNIWSFKHLLRPWPQTQKPNIFTGHFGLVWPTQYFRWTFCLIWSSIKLSQVAKEALALWTRKVLCGSFFMHYRYI